ncbi:MAG: sortase [Microbacteriaceae bacterium]|nr:sortase [Microbacteriaceae bacterium]HEV7955876.1 SURF1 family protein [Marisediminicola sp.]
MRGWRFALSRRWAGYLALTVAFAVVCSLLGAWQFTRRAEARTEIDRIDANYDARPMPVADVLPTLGAFDAGQKWTPVLLEGIYLSDAELLVRNRPLAGRPGFEVLTPLLLEDGTVFIVDRGWVPTGSRQDAPDVVPPAPEGPVTVVARLKGGETVLPGRSTVEGSGQIPTVHLPQVAGMLDNPVYTGAYGLVASEDPAPESAPVAAGKPVRDEGPHLSYALQWFVFALLGFVGLGWALRQEYRVVNADDPDERERSDERARRRAARAPSDSEAEDALLDSR